MTAYQKLCTEFYDSTKPRADIKEVIFYEPFIKRSPGPILEAMCGSGRLLIPLLERGYAIDGVDNSSAMLESLERRCKEKKLTPTIFDQSLQELALPQKYGLIFIAFGSFQLINDRNDALNVLKRLHEHLMPNGTLILETFIPWNSIREHIEGEHLVASKTIHARRSAQGSDGSEIILTATITTQPQEQIETSIGHYEKVLNGNVIASEDSPISVRWYYQYEMELFLEKAGFSLIQVEEQSFPENSQALFYIAQ